MCWLPNTLAPAALPASPDADRARPRHQARGAGVLGGLCGRRAQAALSPAARAHLTAGKIAVDETIAPVLDPGRGRTKQGYFWPLPGTTGRGAN